MPFVRQFATILPILATLQGAASPVSQQPTGPADAQSVPRITQEQFRKMHTAGQVFIVDVRSAEVFGLGRIPGAINAPFAGIELRAEDLTKQARGRPIVAYCSCASEHSAAEAALRLAKRGVKNVSVLVGGYPEWLLGGGKSEKSQSH